MGWVALAVFLAPKSIWQLTGAASPLNLVLSLGQAHESQFAQRHWSSVSKRQHETPWSCGTGRQSGLWTRILKKNDIKAVIPRKSNEKMALDGRSQRDRNAYRNRNVVERCFG
jgi:hypothetical protein